MTTFRRYFILTSESAFLDAGAGLRCYGSVAVVRARDRGIHGRPARGGRDGTADRELPGDLDLVLVYGPPARRAELVRLTVGCLAVLVFLSGFTLGLRGEPRAGSGLQAVLELVSLGCVALAAWALPGAVRRLVAARGVGDVVGPALRLNREGVEFRAREGGDVKVFAPWDLVERCDFRPAPGGAPRWCIDAPIALPPSLSFAAAWAGMVPPSQIEARVGELAATWTTLGAPADRGLLRDSLLFGTPIVVDLARCPGISIPRLDAAVRAWTFGRCGCDPRAWPGRRRRRGTGERRRWMDEEGLSVADG